MKKKGIKRVWERRFTYIVWGPAISRGSGGLSRHEITVHISDGDMIIL
jgi:hypothetical protein